MRQARGLQPCRRRPVLLELVIGIGHPDEAGPHLLAQPGSRLDGELIGGQMLDTFGENRLQRVKPGGKVHTGYSK